VEHVSKSRHISIRKESNRLVFKANGTLDDAVVFHLWRSAPASRLKVVLLVQRSWA